MELPSLRNSVLRIREACQFFSLTHQVTLSQRLVEFYETLAWPGNLRQLFGHMEKKKILSRSIKLDFDHMDEELLTQSSDLMNLDQPLEIKPMKDLKEEYVKKVLSLCEGNLAMASRKLGITEKTVKTILGKVN